MTTTIAIGMALWKRRAEGRIDVEAAKGRWGS
jgi:hypothetical protein